MHEESNKRENFINNAIFRFAQDDETKHVIVNESETIQSMDNQKPLQENKYAPTSKSKISVLPQGEDMRSKSLAPCGRVDLRTDGEKRVRIASRLRTLLRSNMYETLRAWSKFKTGKGEGLKVAFTLAEVLITLGIIGVVATLTLPTLIQHHRKTVIETSLKKFYTTINQAVELSIIDNGETSSWKFADTEAEVGIFYNTYFKKYLKDVKSKDAKIRYYVYFSDGSGVEVRYKGHDWIYCLKAADLGKSFGGTNGSKCFKFGFYPTWGNGKGENHITSNYYNKGVEPYVGASKVDENGNVVGTSPDDIYKLGWYTKAIQLNNWRIPNDYPVRY